jgi:hypothetical protein
MRARPILSSLGLLGGMALAFAASPALVALDLVRRWRIRQQVFRGGAPTCGWGLLALDADVLVVWGRGGAAGAPVRLPLSAIAHVNVTLVDGDAGFADGNAEHHVVEIVSRSGETTWLWATRDASFDGVLAELRTRRLVEGVRFVRGPLRGPGGLLVYVSAALCTLAALAALRCAVRARS